MNDYTPPTEVIRQAVTFERNRPGEPRTIKVEAFERWLAAHDSEVAAKVLDRAVDRVLVSDWWGHGVINEHGNVAPAVREWLHARAAEYRKTETEGK